MSRRPFVLANWKMNHTAREAAAFAASLRAMLAPAVIDALARDRIDVAIAPAFPALDRLGRALEGSRIALAAQDCHEATSGAYTGEVSRAMLVDLGCRHALIGHSERRQHFGDDDRRVEAKLTNLLGSAVRPVLCVGETLAEREAGRVAEVLLRQLAPLGRLREAVQAANSIERPALDVAYEPVWAIGTGRVATPAIAQEAHALIRTELERVLDQAGRGVRILYGGSVKPDNIPRLLEQPDIDGALVGGASLVPSDFASIVSTCCETKLERA